MAKVFISYSRKDIEFARRLTAELAKSELDFWVDWEGIPPTVDWWKEIEKGIEEADAFLFLISLDSVSSKVCRQEIDHAVKNGKRLIPLVIREINTKEVPLQLGSLNWIFFRQQDDFNESITTLLKSIHTDYDWVEAQRRLQVRALEWERNQKENSFLLRGKDLHDAESQLATNSSKDPHPTNIQHEFVSASRKAEDNLYYSSRLRRNIIFVASVVSLITIVLAQMGYFNRLIYRPESVMPEDYWVTIAAGEFQMGSENGYEEEKPVHTVYLDEYQIGKFEITNRQFAQCMKAGRCNGTSDTGGKKDLYPVVNVTWYDANAYCEWAGGRLPTEAEWEKAASWDVETQTKFVYPWGNNDPTPDLLNYYGNVEGVTPVGTYPSGENGLFDMAGNVWEWVNDWYQSDYYATIGDKTSNPQGPSSGDDRVLKGGSWNYDDSFNVRSTNRIGDSPTIPNKDTGFRCARTP